MGLSIHYKGIIRDTGQIQNLVEEVQDICTIFNWKYHLANDENLSGISFTPPECETLCLTFLPGGQLASKLRLMYNIEPATVISVKTQFAGMEVHKTVIGLFRYLSTKYFSCFSLHDESGYWETGDTTVLAEKFDLYNKLLNKVQQTIEHFTALPGEPDKELAKRLENFLKGRLKK